MADWNDDPLDPERLANAAEDPDPVQEMYRRMEQKLPKPYPDWIVPVAFVAFILAVWIIGSAVQNARSHPSAPVGSTICGYRGDSTEVVCGPVLP